MTFRPLLACETPPAVEAFKRHLPLYASYKLDGIRAIVRDGVLVSRTMKPIPSLYAQRRWGRPHYERFDGELLAATQKGATIYHDTYSAVMTFGSLEPVKYYVFDRAPIEAWDDTKEPYTSRADKLKEVLESFPDWEIELLRQYLCTSIEEILVLEQKALDEGHEGLILRRPDGRYKHGRSTFKEGLLMKLARTMTAEARVVGFEEMMHNDNPVEKNALGLSKRASLAEYLRPSGMLGSLVVEDLKTGVRFNLGTGFDHALRKEVWDNQSRYLGKLAKYSFKPYGTKDLPRQPSFVGWRSPDDM